MTLKGVKLKMYEKWKWDRSMWMRLALDPVVEEKLSIAFTGNDNNYYNNYNDWAIWSRKLGIYRNE